ncbi:M23 family metallopeptidase [Clostridium cibarium]|uniref:M23 family metallopeptidase n=1 Tax=Clostridium cibarium TaxID=2762247 RepID=A0ABR8PWY6_9CLOT|nr:M23 family metallopeptidase [Clostridium cibarium]MBD7912659.1 M23 family metallopeptidase [Clostridium cibarium]
MDKNYKQKVKDFFRKEGFYVVLFICLCIVTTVATIAFKKANTSESKSEVADQKQEITLNVDDKDKDVSSQVPNAERVENTQKNQENKDATKAVMTNNNVKFKNPTEGALLRGYTYPKPVKINDKELRTISGIDVQAKVGSDVKAAADGVVENVGQGDVQEGIAILIKHANGMKTKYCNLDSKTLVKQGDKVTGGTVIGKVGTSVKIFGDNYNKEYLNIQVFNANNEQVDPLKYFSYKSKQ